MLKKYAFGVLMLGLFVGLWVSPVLGQANVVNPPAYTIELGSIEPTPGNAAAQVSFSFEQGQQYADNPITAPVWVYSRDVSYPGETQLIACGYTNQPNATLIDPSGQSQTVTVESSFWGSSGTCWSYTLPWAVGTLLGQYTLQLNGDEGSLQRTWQLAYPDYPATLYLQNTQQIFLMGFPPNKPATVLFYGYNGGDAGASAETVFWASRQYKVDSTGTAIINVKLEGNAAFDSMKYLIPGYLYAHLSWRRYDDWRELNNYSTPDTMITDYYNAINNGWYDMAWENLSQHYKDKVNSGHDFAGFYNWWTSVAKVDVDGVTVSNQQNNFATVRTSYTLNMKNGRKSHGVTNYVVIFSPTENRWLFYDQ